MLNPLLLAVFIFQIDNSTSQTLKMVDRANRPSALSPSVTGPQPTVDSDGKKVTATLPTGDSVVVYLYGATVTSWKNKGKEHLWVSEAAKYDGSKAIRGGVPVVFPVRGIRINMSIMSCTDNARTSVQHQRTTQPLLFPSMDSPVSRTGSTWASRPLNPVLWPKEVMIQ